MANLIYSNSKIIPDREVGYGYQPIISIIDGDSAQKVFAAVLDDTTGYLKIYIYASGVWSLETTFSDAGSIDYANFCKAPSNDLFLCYTYGSAGAWTVKVKRRTTAGVWSEIDSVAVAYNTNPQGIITYNRGGLERLHLFYWSQCNNVKNKYSDNYGSSWTSGTDKALYTARDDFQSALYFIDTNPTNGNIVIGVRIYVDSGWRLNVPTFTSVGVYITGSPGTAIQGAHSMSGVYDNAGNLWWVQYLNAYASPWYYNFQFVKNSTGVGAMWLDSPTADWYFNSSICLDLQQNVYVFYQKKSDGKAYYRKYNTLTSTLGSETLLSGALQGHRVASEQRGMSQATVLNQVYYSI